MGLTSSARSDKVNAVLINMIFNLAMTAQFIIVKKWVPNCQIWKANAIGSGKIAIDLENYKFYVNYFGLMPYIKKIKTI